MQLLTPPSNFYKPSLQYFKRRDTIPLNSRGLWQIERGAIRTLTWNEQGKIITLGIWGKGDLVGQPLSEIAPYEVECLSSVSAILIPCDRWYLLVDSLLEHARQAGVFTTILRCEPVRDRVRYFLHWLAQKFGHRVTYGKLIAVRLSHQCIAEVLGTSRVTVTRILKQLEAEGTIVRDRRDLIWREEEPIPKPPLEGNWG
ncbi:Crp/Fnr family transcriptional regulator [Oscillatoriales cyanobacterium LEGE 11467]|uniref:Crp/Fnr family transcriptional regulator n=1 Tax=Zarconia navalis LEGE 11467 TaxID=1828826 RepID=A0A928Z7W9_9CYAN|nr:Crp/Fnr family transcriptional regulator [Zarconia navalis]MBE9041857.1 Crp/Fnr family transcriptional regulator [Zarconia navalis LEGE 11467]